MLLFVIDTIPIIIINEHKGVYQRPYDNGEGGSNIWMGNRTILGFYYTRSKHDTYSHQHLADQLISGIDVPKRENGLKLASLSASKIDYGNWVGDVYFTRFYNLKRWFDPLNHVHKSKQMYGLHSRDMIVQKFRAKYCDSFYSNFFLTFQSPSFGFDI